MGRNPGVCTRIVLIGSPVLDGCAAVGATLTDLGRGRAGPVVDLIDVMTGPADAERPPGSDGGNRLVAGGRPISWDLRGLELDAVEDLVRARLTSVLHPNSLLIAPAAAADSPVRCGLARAALAAARSQAAILLEYPQWPHDSTSFENVQWTRLRLLAPSLTALRSKESVLPALGDLAAARCVAEIVALPGDPELAERSDIFAEPADAPAEVANRFDAMLTEGATDDPWHLDDSPYERRRLELVLACLGRPHYARVIEIGCATGQLSVQLAERADLVIAVDASAKALEVARRNRTPNIRWVLGAVPQDFPAAEADVVILSEIGYFLDGPDLLATVRAARRALRPTGEIVVANWRRPTEHIPLDGPAVQAQVADIIDLPLRARYQDADLVIEVWGEPVSVYDEYAEPPDRPSTAAEHERSCE
ncbi:class I SAM-dependent methyltransferase [Mycolicibacterium fluoranthenivorans]|uniref:SAM-dependent methyltransferase n=1 Tax=Mycolicibacterium fluoranthenivorans TaxID=258505 RepID=A0A7X5TVX2_9MYCO|nr:class I SAM-dependent methyltransferase [Mycolicibacterium fluoranthenivorans]MCV7359079.1 methyltransferase domain-containing protein [Mycolicibacterium fluoranthenivorans]NIH93737.1 SAM-dependent methyltransferase [Mycolicibacterium fluoranthenivorans]